MTAERRARYSGSKQYLYKYDGNAARVPQQWEDAPAQRKQSKRRRRAPRSATLEVREPGKFAPFAVVGLAAVCCMVIVMLGQSARLVEINDQAVNLRGQMETLKSEEDKLLAQYELAYDLQAIEQELLSSGEMVKAQSGQIYTIPLQRPDSAEYYKKEGLVAGFLAGVKEIFSAIGTYF